MTAIVDTVAGPVIERILHDASAIFSEASMAVVAPGTRVPRVTLDLPASDPEPFHVFVWGTAREFGVEGALTGGVYAVSFHVWMTVIGSGSTADDASDVANAYQALALQLTLCDVTLGGLAVEVMAPAIREGDAWADADGRRHAGYLLDYEVVVRVRASAEISAILQAADAAGTE